MSEELAPQSKLSEGKTKIIWETNDQDVCVIVIHTKYDNSWY